MKELTGELRELFKAALAMRESQREYFKKPILGKLIAAKTQEKKLDELLMKISGQLDLFPEPNGEIETATTA